MAVKQKKRRWSAEEKISICLQTTTPGVSVAQVARRYALNAHLIFKWLRDDRYACSLDAVPKPDSPVFLPIEVEGPARPAPVSPLPRLAVSRSSFLAGVGSLPKAGLMRMCWHGY
jgi:transposase